MQPVPWGGRVVPLGRGPGGWLRAPCARTVGSRPTLPCVPNFGERNCGISDFTKLLSLCHGQLSFPLSSGLCCVGTGEQDTLASRSTAGNTQPAPFGGSSLPTGGAVRGHGPARTRRR